MRLKNDNNFLQLFQIFKYFNQQIFQLLIEKQEISSIISISSFISVILIISLTLTLTSKPSCSRLMIEINEIIEIVEEISWCFFLLLKMNI
jgi:spore germination protein GerM